MNKLLSKRKPINFTTQEVKDVENLIGYTNSIKSEDEKKDTFSSVVRDRAIAQIRKELKQIERGNK